MQKISKKPPRFRQDISIYFLTFCTFHWQPILHRPDIPTILIDSLLFYSKRIKELIAYTVMPNHVHLLVEVETVSDLSNFLRDFKKYTSKQIKQKLGIHDSYVWQRGTYDHCIRFSWRNTDFENHVRYIFYNSWKHLRIRPKDFAYHNFSAVVERGWLDPDFCDFPPGEGKPFEQYEK